MPGYFPDRQSALDPRSPDAELVADLWWAMLIVAAIVLVVVTLLVLAAVLRRRGAGPARALGGSRAWTMVAVGGVAAPLLAAAALVAASTLIGRAQIPGPEADRVTVEVIGRLWWWEVHYLNAAGERIATTANEIHVPVGRHVRFLLRSDNVIHSFWVPNLQGKMDLIPGQANEVWTRVVEPGVFRGQCAEFCGLQHAYMALLVIAEPPERFAQWLAAQASPAVVVSGPVLVRGREAFFAAGCPECHTIRGTAADGDLGPDLTHIGARRTLAAAIVPNTRGHLGGWIANPQHIKPGAAMPPTTLPPDAFQALLSYLEALQ